MVHSDAVSGLEDKWPIALYVRQLVEGANNTEVGSSADASSVQATLKSATNGSDIPFRLFVSIHLYKNILYRE